MKDPNSPTRIKIQDSFVLSHGVVAVVGDEHLVPWWKARELAGGNKCEILQDEPAAPVIDAPQTRDAAPDEPAGDGNSPEAPAEGDPEDDEDDDAEGDEDSDEDDDADDGDEYDAEDSDEGDEAAAEAPAGNHPAAPARRKKKNKKKRR